MTQTINTKESRQRSVLKAFSYRVLGTLATGVIAWSVTGDVQVAFTIGAVEPAVKMVLYYLHERAWQKVPDRSLARP